MNFSRLSGQLKAAPRNILKEIENLLDDCEHGRHHRARRLVGTFTWCGISVQGEHLMITEPLVVGQSVSYSVSPVKSDGSASKATLSNVVITSSDPAVFTVAPDPSNPNGVIIVSVGAGSATVNSKATATEPDGTTTETITGADTVVVTAAPPPPPAPAVALVGKFGTPFPTPPPNPV